MTDEDPDPRLKTLAEAEALTGNKAAKYKIVGEILPVQDRIALLDASVRRTTAFWIMGLFGAVTIVTMLFVYLLFRADQADLAAKIIGPGDRVVNAEVLVSLLGATTVQLGTVLLIMARYVFKAPG